MEGEALYARPFGAYNCLFPSGCFSGDCTSYRIRLLLLLLLLSMFLGREIKPEYLDSHNRAILRKKI